jgi:hypothetical protein
MKTRGALEDQVADGSIILYLKEIAGRGMD